MPNTLLQPWSTLLVLLHAACAIVLIGSSTHHAIIAIGTWRGRPKPRLARIYAATVLIAYALTFLLGALAYPTFRYHVRALYLDRFAPWASNLFDLKENLAALGLPFALGAFLLSRAIDYKDDRALFPGYALMVLAPAAIVWFDLFSGLAITMTRGLP